MAIISVWTIYSGPLFLRRETFRDKSEYNYRLAELRDYGVPHKVKIRIVHDDTVHDPSKISTQNITKIKRKNVK